jgi:hypothetical protein
MKEEFCKNCGLPKSRIYEHGKDNDWPYAPCAHEFYSSNLKRDMPEQTLREAFEEKYGKFSVNINKQPVKSKDLADWFINEFGQAVASMKSDERTEEELRIIDEVLSMIK